MSKINFFAISGMDEKSRSCYVLEIDKNIYILNCGVESPITESLGVSKFVPDMTYLVNNKEKIRAILIGTATMQNIGALDFLIEKLGNNIPIITSEISKTVIMGFLSGKYKIQDKIDGLKFIEVTAMRDLVLENGQCIVPFKIVNSMPNSLGFVFRTTDGCIVFLDNYIICNDQSKAFYSQLANIRDIINRQPVLLLITQTGIVDKSKNFTAPHHNNKEFYENIISNTANRVIVAIHEHDAYSLFSIAQVAKKYQKQFIIYSRNSINLFQATIKAGLFSNKGLISLPISELKNQKNVIIVITGEPEKLFGKIHKILDDEDDRIQFIDTDTFVLGTKLIAGYEGLASKLLDKISKFDIHTVVMPKTILPLEPSNEDHKFTASLIQPKFIIPVGGLYKTFAQYMEVINETWMKKNQVLILANGEVASFYNGELESIKQKYNFEVVPMSAFGSSDITSSVLYERNQMTENGTFAISFIINDKKEIISRLDMLDYGVINHDDNNALSLLKRIHAEIEKNIYNYFIYKDENLDLKETKLTIKKAITKLFDKMLDKRPIVLPTIVEVNQ